MFKIIIDTMVSKLTGWFDKLSIIIQALIIVIALVCILTAIVCIFLTQHIHNKGTDIALEILQAGTGIDLEKMEDIYERK